MATAVYFGIIQIRKLSDEKYLSFVMNHFLQKIGPQPSLQSGTLLFSDGWWGIGTGVLNYDTLFQSEELQNSEKSFYDKWTRDYRISCFKIDYSLDRRQNSHVPDTDFFRPWTTAIFSRCLCIRKHWTKERISCIGKFITPTKFRTLLVKKHYSDSLA